jgi:hypothetical protein
MLAGNKASRAVLSVTTSLHARTSPPRNLAELGRGQHSEAELTSTVRVSSKAGPLAVGPKPLGSTQTPGEPCSSGVTSATFRQQGDDQWSGSWNFHRRPLCPPKEWLELRSHRRAGAADSVILPSAIARSADGTAIAKNLKGFSAVTDTRLLEMSGYRHLSVEPDRGTHTAAPRRLTTSGPGRRADRRPRAASRGSTRSR